LSIHPLWGDVLGPTMNDAMAHCIERWKLQLLHGCKGSLYRRWMVVESARLVHRSA